MQTARTLILGVGLVAFIQLSCSKGQPRLPTFPVTGKVLLYGKPAEHATVVFHPVSESGTTPRPRGKVSADGTFTLTTYDGNDGAPAGEYRVTLELWLASKNADEPPSNNLPAALANPETSGLKATVNAGPTDLKAFEIK